MTSLRIRPVLAWDDFWVGVHWNQKNCRLHVLPLPTLGFVIEWASRMTDRTIMPGERVVALARDWIGTPYHHQEARKRVGADCLGLIRGLWRELYGAEAESAPAYTRTGASTGARSCSRRGRSATWCRSRRRRTG